MRKCIDCQKQFRRYIHYAMVSMDERCDECNQKRNNSKSNCIDKERTYKLIDENKDFSNEEKKILKEIVRDQGDLLLELGKK